MGGIFSRYFGSAFKIENKIVMMGLDAAGKTTIVYKLKLGDVVTTIPTIGMNVESVTYKKLHMDVFDVGGRGMIRPLFRHYYQNCTGVIFVVDSNDRERVSEAKDELERLMREDELKNAPFLIFANKQDLPNAMSILELTEKLELHRVSKRRWFVQSSCATSGDGLFEGLDWLSNAAVASARGDPVEQQEIKASQSSTSTIQSKPIKNEFLNDEMFLKAFEKASIEFCKSFDHSKMIRLIDIKLKDSSNSNAREWLHSALKTFAKQSGHAKHTYHYARVEFWLNAVELTHKGVLLQQTKSIAMKLDDTDSATLRQEKLVRLLPETLINAYYNHPTLVSKESFQTAVQPDKTALPAAS